MNKDISNLFDFVILDIETTGLDKEKDNIIEISARKYLGEKNIANFSCFIKQKEKIPLFIKKLTNITDEDLLSGITIKKALKDLQVFVEDSLIICHNTEFDIEFIKYKSIENSFLNYFKNNIFYDTLEIAKIFLPFLSNHKLSTLANYFKLEAKASHRACNDTETTANLFISLLKFIEKNIPLNLLNDILEISSKTNFYSNLSSFLKKVIDFKRKNFSPSLIQIKENLFYSINYINSKNEEYEEFSEDLDYIFNNTLAKNIENYEKRIDQVKMSKNIYSSLENAEFLISEAGTGIGKTYAYLIPSIIFSKKKNDAKIVISTNTKNLQAQLFEKDLPLIKNSLSMNFKAILLKGRSNYLCLRKWEQATKGRVANLSPYEAKGLAYLLVWQYFTNTGDISENASFPKNYFAHLWLGLMSERYTCYKKNCSYYTKCYLMKTKKKLETSNLIVINHSLLFSDFIKDNVSLGKYDYLIIDEAHNLVYNAMQHLGQQISLPEITNFLSYLFSSDKKKFQSGIFASIEIDNQKSTILKKEKNSIKKIIKEEKNIIEQIHKLITEYFHLSKELLTKKGSFGKLRIKDDFLKSNLLVEIILLFMELDAKLAKLHLSLTDNNLNFINYEKHLTEIETSKEKIKNTLELLNILKSDDENLTVWLQTEAKVIKENNIYINITPLNINEILSNKLYDTKKSIIFTSASLSINNSFKYFSSQVGLNLIKKKINSLIFPSPFDYKKQSLIAISKFLKDPLEINFSNKAVELLKNLIGKTRLGSLILFTSYKDLNAIQNNLSSFLYENNILLLSQSSQTPKETLLKEFKKIPESVLLGTNSFWEGVDIPGETLSLLIIYKLPFQVPKDPIIESYIEKIEKEGKNSFMHYILPNSLLRYKQGFGRLIRNQKDKGIFLILDNRINSKAYGKYFKEILPTVSYNFENEDSLIKEIVNWFQN